jgi:ribonuclease T1
MHVARVLLLLFLSLLIVACGEQPAETTQPQRATTSSAETAIAIVVGTPTTPAHTSSTPRPKTTSTPSPTRAPSTAKAKATPTPRPTAASPQTIDGFRVVSLSELPKEARHTLDLIEQDGPFPYRQDGAVFQNREGILPRKRSGYYHEYTVETPGSPDRGARRIITGAQSEIYYTADHYDSFVRVLIP